MKLTFECTRIKAIEIHFQKAEDKKWNQKEAPNKECKVIPPNILNLNLNIHLNLQISKIDSYKLEDGNGLIQSSKELVLVLVEGILQLYLVPLLSSLEGITTREKLKVILI